MKQVAAPDLHPLLMVRMGLPACWRLSGLDFVPAARSQIQIWPVEQVEIACHMGKKPEAKAAKAEPVEAAQRRQKVLRYLADSRKVHIC